MIYKNTKHYKWIFCFANWYICLWFTLSVVVIKYRYLYVQNPNNRNMFSQKFNYIIVFV